MVGSEVAVVGEVPRFAGPRGAGWGMLKIRKGELVPRYGLLDGACCVGAAGWGLLGGGCWMRPAGWGCWMGLAGWGLLGMGECD